MSRPADPPSVAPPADAADPDPAPAGPGGRTNRNKARGTRHERETANRLRADGYQVWRVAGSLGSADLIAAKPGQLLLVQVKSQPPLGRHLHIGPAAWNQLYDDARACAGIPIVAVVGFRRITWWQITGRKDRPTRTPPWAEWRADQVNA